MNVPERDEGGTEREWLEGLRPEDRDYELWCVAQNGDTMCALSADHEGPHTNGIEVWNA